MSKDSGIVFGDEMAKSPEAMAAMDGMMNETWKGLYKGRERNWWKKEPEPIANDSLAVPSLMKSLGDMGIDWRKGLTEEEVAEVEAFIVGHGEAVMPGQKTQGVFESELDVDHKLFVRLRKENPEWWINLKNDDRLYIDVRKGNYLNVYHNGGALMKLEGIREYIAKIHSEYIPLQKDTDYHSFDFSGGKVALKDVDVLDVKDFEEAARDKIVKRIEKFYPSSSEKGIQGRYITYNNGGHGSKEGFFIDTEFQFNVDCYGKTSSGRIDLVWINKNPKMIVLVELKTMTDARLIVPHSEDQESIEKQLEKYRAFAAANTDELTDHYRRVFQVKRNLGILPDFMQMDSIDDFPLLVEPVLLVGDCTQSWIDKEAEGINDRLRGIAYGCLYQGPKTFRFELPAKTSRNAYRLEPPA